MDLTVKEARILERLEEKTAQGELVLAQDIDATLKELRSLEKKGYVRCHKRMTRRGQMCSLWETIFSSM